MITLASDFGSPYPAAMRGVILARSDARLVDVAHDFPRQDVRSAAFWLREVLPWFPPAVHLVVVDPGVGTDRDAVVVRAGDHALVGPDNGVLVPAARALALTSGTTPDPSGAPPDGPSLDPDSAADGDGAGADGGADAGDDPDPAATEGVADPTATEGVEAHVIEDDDALSSTFHGRDVFAPAAAAVHEAGVDALRDLSRLSPADGLVDLRFPDPAVEAGGATATVLVVDGFGNVVTNLPGELLADVGAVRVDGDRVPVGGTFAAVPEGHRVVTVGSHGNVELDVNHGRGDEAFGLDPGDEVRLTW